MRQQNSFQPIWIAQALSVLWPSVIAKPMDMKFEEFKPCCSMSGDGDVDQFFCIFLAGHYPPSNYGPTYPSLGVSDLNTLLLPAIPDASDASDVIQRCPSQASVIQWLEIVEHTKRPRTGRRFWGDEGFRSMYAL